ncbi:MAG: TonB-dependent receptor [Bacteroidetes bacterium]|nr:TonB-dependent receptor [Bacteroidota bacterium]
MKRIVATLFVIQSALISMAQVDYDLDTIDISTVRVPLKMSETGRNITVITAKEIQSLPATSLDEILQTITSVEIQSRGGFGTQGDILMRGSTFTQVLVLIDGMKMNDPLTGHFNSYIPIQPAEIERIEILRGAAAAIYGADAVGGVINVITKTFSASHQKDGMEVSGNLNRGQHRLTSTNQGFNYRSGKVTFGAGFMLNQSDGEFIPAKILDTATTLSSYNNYFNNYSAGASFAYRFSDQYSLHIRSSFDFRDFGARYFYTTSPFDKSTERVTNFWNQMRLQKQTAKTLTDLNIAYKYNTDSFMFSPDFASTNIHTSQFLNLTLNHMIQLDKNITVKGGLQADKRKIESTDRGDHENYHFGAYVMGVYRHNGLNITTSLRGDYDNNYQFEFSPQVNVSYVKNKLVIRGSAGKSIRAADYTERFVSNSLKNLTPGRSLGNPDLVAERSWSEELGLNYTIVKNWQVKATGFVRQSGNLIDYVLTNQSEIGSVSSVGSLQPGADYYFAKNVTKVQTYGFEIESGLRKKINSETSLIWNLGYTYLNTSNADDVVSVYIASHAKHLITNKLILNIHKFEFAVTTLYKERLGVIAPEIATVLAKTYTLWNSRIGYMITPEFGLNIQIQNAFDVQYQNILGSKMPGRWIMAGVLWRIKK